MNKKDIIFRTWDSKSKKVRYEKYNKEEDCWLDEMLEWLYQDERKR